MNCNLCNSESFETIFDYTRFEKQDIIRCKNCGLVCLRDIKTQAVYREDYRKADTLPLLAPSEMFLDPIIQQDIKNRLDWIAESYGNIKGKRILEIGCASGYFLKALGENAVGIELNRACVDYARDLGCAVIQRTIEGAGFHKEFDLIVTFHTLEHVSNPMAVFKAVKLALKPGGVFMGEVPNQDDWRLKIFDSYAVKRFHYDPFHNYYFSPDTLRKYLTDFTVSLSTVERYNSLVQLRRILCGEYDTLPIETILKRDVFAKTGDDVRIPRADEKETAFNKLFGDAVNSKLMGNCLRFVAEPK